MKKFLALMLAVLMMLGCTAMFTSCGEEEETLIGFDIDLARAVVEYLNETYDSDVEIEFVVIDWNQKEALLENGSIDLVWNGMTINDERIANMAMSVPYLANKQVAIVAKDKAASFGTTVESFAEAAKDCIVTFEKGSAGEGIAITDDKLNFGKDSLASATQLEALNALKKGDADIAIIDSVMAGYYMNTGDSYKDFQILSDIVLAEEEYGIGAKKGNDALIGKINEAIIALVNKDYKTVAETYGLTSELLVKADTVNPQAGATDGSWDKIVQDGKLVIGYTKFAPIAYDKD